MPATLERLAGTNPNLEEKACHKCSLVKPISEFRWVPRTDGRKPRWTSYCNKCTRDDSRKRNQAQRNLPIKKRELPKEKACSDCGVVKPAGEFYARKHYGYLVLMGPCKLCSRKASREWVSNNAEKARARRRKYYAKGRAALRIIGSVDNNQDLDIIRKAAVQAPPPLLLESERLAYFRGFIAGSRRAGYESDRFERLKDLAHRIASEKRIQRGISYEEAISFAYQGLLDFIRKKPDADPEKDRALAAQHIRYRIIEYKRSDGPYRRNGEARCIGTPGMESDDDRDGPITRASVVDEQRADHSDLEASILEAIEANGVDTRLGEVLKMRAKGFSFRECGERFGTSETWAYYLIASNMAFLREKILPMFGSAATDLLEQMKCETS